MSKELKFEDIEYNGMYGDLIAEIDPIIEDCSFDAHNGAGLLQKYGGYAVVGFEVLNAVFQEYDEDNNILGEYEVSPDDAQDLLDYDQDGITEVFSDYLEEYE